MTEKPPTADDVSALMEAAAERVRQTPALWPYEAVLLANWGDEAHWRAVLIQPVDVLIAWAEQRNLPDD